MELQCWTDLGGGGMLFVKYIKLPGNRPKMGFCDEFAFRSSSAIPKLSWKILCYGVCILVPCVL